MDGWTSMQSSSKDLHEAIKQSLNGILYSNTQGLNMNGGNEVTENQMGLFRDEDLERALKLSLNPEEQTSKEQQEYVLAYKESLMENKSKVTNEELINRSIKYEEEINEKGPLPLSVKNSNSVSSSNAKIKNDEKSISPINISPTNTVDGNIFSTYKSSVEDERVNIKGETNETSVITIPENIHCVESIRDIKSVKTNNVDNITDLANAIGLSYDNSDIPMVEVSNENNLGCKNTSKCSVQRSPTKDTNKKKRKTPSGENNIKQGSANKPIPLAQAAAVVKEAPVLSIQDIQEEERQIQEAIERSKRELSVGGKNYEKVNKYSETVVRGKSPNSANKKASNNPFDILKDQDENSSTEASLSTRLFPGRVSAGAATGYLEDEQKQIREAIERSIRDTSSPINDSEMTNGIPSDNVPATLNMQGGLKSKNPIGTLNPTLVKNMSEEEQLRYALQMSSKEMGIMPPKSELPLSIPSSSSTTTVHTPLINNSNTAYNNILKTAGHPNITNKSLTKRKELGTKSQRRPIVIDGCNVAYHHGRHDMFSAQGLKVMYDEFINLGWQSSEIHIFVKPSRMTDVDRGLCDSLEKIGVLHWTPKRRVGHHQFTSDDDDMILEYARKKGGVIVTRDQYRDSYDRCPEFKEVIEKRLLQFNFINDDVIFPRDPLGKSGPSLDEFLRF